ncbi:MAG: HAMP domain-containing protein [Gemmatimonadetes bacterium]|nr:HAMP domain-containing protein [Gemmatimonadota bacterium]MBI2402997.1 HAMP domain-containing protein [Gemmatimonadota bacterium]
MSTIRGRLVVFYAAALVATITVFAGTVYLLQRSENFAELDARARLEADLIAELLTGAARGPDSVVVLDPETRRPVLRPRIASVLQVLQDYVMVLGPDSQVLFLSDDAAALPYETLLRLVRLAGQPSPEDRVGLTNLGAPAGEVRYLVRAITGAGPEVSQVVSGASTAGLVLGPQRLLSAMLLTAPLIIGLSILIGHFLVGRTLQPVDAIVEEVAAITDGRSLHRRLIEPRSRDELARLSDTLNAMLARLERSFASLRRFTADASHELKTPLTVLRSGIERAITHPKAPPEVMEVLEETLVEVNRMAELVDALLTLARADEGRAPLHLEPVELKDVLSEVSETAGILGEQAHVAVSVAVPDRSITLAVDPSRIRQLLMNLLTNAIKYTPRGGEVAIDWEQVDGNVVLNVRDTGVGIAPGDLPHIFDRFWRADQARRRSGGRPGVGLGLAISKWIVEAHGGTIAVQSRPGRGTTFTVTLPMGTA